MQDFSTMARQMQNIASPGKMPMATMQGRGPIAGPGPQMTGPPPAAVPPVGMPGVGLPGGNDQLMQMIMQIAQQIEQVTGQPATPEQIQAALSQAMPGLEAGGAATSPGGAPPAQAGQPMVPPMTTMKR